MPYKIKIRTNILIHFLFLVLALAIVLIGLQYYFSENMAKKAISSTFHRTAEKITLTLHDKDNLSKEILYQIETDLSLSQEKDKTAKERLIIKYFISTLKRHDTMYAIYLGYANGDLFEVVNMKLSKKLYQHYKAPKETRWTLIKIYNEGNSRIRKFIFLDHTLKKLSERSEPSGYTVTKRLWYQEAIAATLPVRSDPYLFTNLQDKGITYSKKLPGETVLALDFTLNTMHSMIKSLRFSPSSNIYLYGRDGSIISASDTTKSDMENVFQKMLKQQEINRIKVIDHHHSKAFVTLMPLTQELGKETYVGISVETHEMLSPYREKIYYSLTIAMLLLLLFIPVTLYLTNHIVKPIKALMQENEKIKARKFEQVSPVETNIIELIELSESQLALSGSIQEYQRQQEALLDAFIMLIADAIDTKSSYTGAHCKKVPILATMLAKEADKSNDDPFKTFHFKDPDAWESFERAAWLHDCGKITTPEYIVDKATKLETIYNRIHEIRTRFEVLWRDIEITYYERLIQGEERSLLSTWKEKEQQILLDDFSFVAACNLGGEFLSQEKQARLKQIAQRRWLRHFDNRLGLTEEELARYRHLQHTSLPVSEKLLYDGKEHLIERVGFDETAYHKKGFKMEVPHYLYNRGELYNLCIEKGTLTPEERFKINEHIIMTIKMLEQLPFPDAMKSIPTIAGEHHETMDGTGYPKQLRKEELSIPSRILAVADIFEALTASDRPYKEAKTLSETLKIMYFMKKEEHIDADIFDLFVSSGIYLAYAKTYLKEEQIDTVDEASLLG
jgi:HD-GYP domain-containing protein (c-di-GMP phosphodiesterase class II)